MKEINLKAVYGDVAKNVRLNNITGVPEQSWQITIDNYYQGNLIFLNGQWIAHLNDKSELSFEDIQIMIEAVNSAR